MPREYKYRGVRFFDVRGNATAQDILSDTCDCTHGPCKNTKVRALLQKVLAYKNEDVVLSIAKTLNCTREKAIEVFTDVKRFLFMAAKVGVPVTPTPVIDEGWHAFMVFTADYRKFCFDNFGMFLDHNPRRMSGKPFTLGDIFPSIDAMHKVFGKIPSKNWNFGKPKSVFAMA